ncbi:MAG: Dibenzothiophene desulfurization enzyme C [Paracidovorax wautersii]|uniref:Dibenzothiophene monooxygenase n=1 Tax=Paracidovorax wautersii TaxID=1177982 RepID=A0A7V8FPD4_9BURK|nr:MAG: Dibenzothiophene desulfurization enzyme C [Paracidovorax wautersii]
MTHPASDLVETARALGARLAASAAARDAARQLPHEEMRALAASGILAARVPRAAGGPEVDLPTLAALFVHIAQGDPNIAQAMQPHACGIEKIKLYGDARQQQFFFGLVRDGALITNASAERSGRVVGDIHTVLEPADGAWRLHGTKHYCTGSLFASHFYVLSTRRGPDAGERARSLAIVPRERAGVDVSDDWDGMGQRTTASGTVRFDGVAVQDAEHLPLPDAGTRRTHEGAYAQLLHAAVGGGIALAALDDAAAYGRDHARAVPEARVARASDDPYVQQSVGQMAVLAHGAQALLERAARILEPAAAAVLAGKPDERQLGLASVAVA